MTHTYIQEVGVAVNSCELSDSAHLVGPVDLLLAASPSIRFIPVLLKLRCKLLL